MLKRKVDDSLTAWKNKPDRKCLMIRGARQIGKTTSVRNFGKNYGSFIEINFLKNPGLSDVFSGNLDADTLLLYFSLYLPDAAFIPGDTLLFLDEIQECPNAITSLKFWMEDGRFDVIASGSMLGIDYKRPVSYPVGAVDYIDMYPLSFEEFLWAKGIGDNVTDILRDHFRNPAKIPDALNDKMLSLLHEYMCIGGMPEVVNMYVNGSSVSDCHEKQKGILRDYRYDIAHYASADIKIKAEKCYFSLPDQLSKENHKFKYSTVEKGGNARKYESSLDWLLGAYLVLCCHNVSRLISPLASVKISDNFRIYPTDIGLFTSMFDYSLKKTIFSNELDRDHGYLRGGVYEALIAEMLYKNGHGNLFFRKAEQGTFEIEFLLDDGAGVIPIEVKSGNSRSRSLDNALKREEISCGYKLIGGNAGKDGKKITLPLYMAMFM